MNYFLRFIFIFFIGCIFGWILEVFYRRIEAKKWINPGFLTGPYLPIYGFAFCTLTDLYLMFEHVNIHPIFIIFPHFFSDFCFLQVMLNSFNPTRVCFNPSIKEVEV